MSDESVFDANARVVAMGNDAYEVEVIVRGPETTRETNYGDRTERETLAQLELAAPSETAFEVFRQALDRLTKPELYRDFLISPEAKDINAEMGSE